MDYSDTMTTVSSQITGKSTVKTSKPTLLALCEDKPLVTGFPSQRAINAESVTMS